MKNKKCPYCGRRISYWKVFNSKNKGIYECKSCNKRSKVKIDKRLIALFVVICLVILVFMLMWNMFLGLANNVFGIIIVAVVVFGFYFTTPLFVDFVPIKSVLEDNRNRSKGNVEISNSSAEYKFNREAFDIIKQRKNQANNMPGEPNNAVEHKVDSIIDSIEKEPYVPIIEDVSEAHFSSEEPLQKVSHTRVFPKAGSVPVEDVKIDRPQQPKKKRPDGSKFTANRKL